MRGVSETDFAQIREGPETESIGNRKKSVFYVFLSIFEGFFTCFTFFKVFLWFFSDFLKFFCVFFLIF